jgi:hypothetical protein
MSHKLRMAINQAGSISSAFHRAAGRCTAKLSIYFNHMSSQFYSVWRAKLPVPVANLIWLAVDRESGDAVV